MNSHIKQTNKSVDGAPAQSCEMLHKYEGALRCTTRWEFYIFIIISYCNDASSNDEE